MNAMKVSPEATKIPIPELIDPSTCKQTNNKTRTLKWTNLSYRVATKGPANFLPDCLIRNGPRVWPSGCKHADQGKPSARAPACRDKQPILNNLSGNITDGCLTAILGPSGSGKSTLIECLFGKRKTGVTGDIRYTGFGGTNGAPAAGAGISSSSPICFIAQEDHLFDKLTVRETVMFAFCVKNSPANVTSTAGGVTGGKDGASPCLWSPSDKRTVRIAKEETGETAMHDVVTKDVTESGKGGKDRYPDIANHKVTAVLSQLWLDMCADVLVGDCSGGQKKRISIACELVSDPGLLFLDEPTSGLDSSTALQCLQMLKGLTSSQTTNTGSGCNNLAILLSIHQPSSRILELFDNIYILSRQGTNLYFGPPCELVSYLSSFDLHCPKFHNPADFVIEIASSTDATHLIDSRRPSVVLPSAKGTGLTFNKPKARGSDSMAELVRLMRLILERHTKTIAREPLLTSMRLLVHVVVALAVSLLYGSDPGQVSGCNAVNQYGAENLLDQKVMVYSNMNLSLMFFILFFLTFTSLTPTILTFPSELKVFLKENCNGWYKTSVYFAAVTIMDIPMTVMFPTAFVLMIYPMTGQHMAPDRFLLFVLVSCLVSFVSQSVGILISILFSGSMKVIVFLAPVSLTPAFLFSGFFVRQSLTPAYLKPLNYLSYVKYSLDALITIVYGLDRCRSVRLLRAALSQSDDEDRSVLVSDELPTSHSFLNQSLLIDPLSANTSLVNQNFGTISTLDSNSSDLMFTSAQFRGSNQFFSYVMKEFDLREQESMQQIRDSCLMLLFMIIILRAASFMILLRKTQATR